ncbi:MAG: hypothetical protein ABIJ22_00190 [Patescibacteria group bacterium]
MNEAREDIKSLEVGSPEPTEEPNKSPQEILYEINATLGAAPRK